MRFVIFISDDIGEELFFLDDGLIFKKIFTVFYGCFCLDMIQGTPDKR